MIKFTDFAKSHCPICHRKDFLNEQYANIGHYDCKFCLDDDTWSFSFNIKGFLIDGAIKDCLSGVAYIKKSTMVDMYFEENTGKYGSYKISDHKFHASVCRVDYLKEHVKEITLTPNDVLDFDKIKAIITDYERYLNF